VVPRRGDVDLRRTVLIDVRVAQVSGDADDLKPVDPTVVASSAMRDPIGSRPGQKRRAASSFTIATGAASDISAAENARPAFDRNPQRREIVAGNR
jgi:hypothetical protein